MNIMRPQVVAKVWRYKVSWVDAEDCFHSVTVCATTGRMALLRATKSANVFGKAPTGVTVSRIGWRDGI